MMLCGPRIEVPVVLSKTWKPSLTICTYCVWPTSPFVSGGAQLQLTPGNWMPLKFRIGLGISGVGAFVFWTTGSTLSTWLFGMYGLRGPSWNGVSLSPSASASSSTGRAGR